MRRLVWIWTLVLLLVPWGNIHLAVDVDARTVISGDWVVVSPEMRIDQEIELRGNLTVLPGGSLTLRNVTLLINISFDLEFGVSVYGGGALYVLDGSSISVLNRSLRTRFRVDPGGVLLVERASLDRVGNTTASGVEIYSQSVTLRDSVISNSSVGLNVHGVELTAENILFYGDMVGVRAGQGANVTLLTSTVRGAITGVEALSSRVTMDGSRIENTNMGITATGSTVEMVTTVLASNIRGLSANASRVNITSSRIERSTQTAVHAFNGSLLDVRSSMFVLNPTAFDMGAGSSGSVNTSSISGGSVDYTLDGAWLDLTDSTHVPSREVVLPGSGLNVSWGLTVRVLNESSLPVYGARVDITHPGLNYSSGGYTNSMGYAPTTPLLAERVSASGRWFAGDYTVSASYLGSNNSTSINMSRTSTLYLRVYSPPPSPSISAIVPDTRSAEISWIPYTGGMFYSYSIFLSKLNGSTGSLVMEIRSQQVSTAVLTSLQPEVTYYVSIRLLLSDGRSAFSPQVGFRTLSEFPEPHRYLAGIDISSGTLLLSNGTYFIDGNVSVSGSATLRVVNATVVLNSSVPLQYGVGVNGSGTLTSEDAVFTSTSMFKIDVHARVSLSDTRLLHLAGPGMGVHSGDASFTNLTIIDSITGVDAHDVDLAVAGVTLFNVSTGVRITDGSVYMTGLTASGGDTVLQVLRAGYAIVRNASLTGCGTGLSFEGTRPIIEQGHILTCGTAISLTNTTLGTVKGMDISGSVEGLVSTSSDMDLRDLNITTSQTGIRVVSGRVDVSASSLRSNGVGLSSSGGVVSIQGSEISSSTWDGIDASSTSLSITNVTFRDNAGAISLTGGLITASDIQVTATGPPRSGDVHAVDANVSLTSLDMETTSDALVLERVNGVLDTVSIRNARKGLALVDSDLLISTCQVKDSALYSLEGRGSNLTGSGLTLVGPTLIALMFTSSNITLSNSSIATSGIAASLRDATLHTVATTIDTSRVTLSGEASIDVGWFLSVTVFDGDNRPQANVTLEVIANGTYAGRYLTDENGRILWVRVTVERMNATVTRDLNPVVVRASRANLSQEKSVVMDANAYLFFLMNPPPKSVRISGVAAVYEDSIRLEWEAVGEGELVRLDVLTREINGTSWNTSNSYSGKIPDPVSAVNLTPDREYAFMLRGYNRDGAYTDSNEVSARTSRYNHRPVLTNASVPSTVYENEPFELSVEYSDEDGDPPAFVRAYVGGSYLNMRASNRSPGAYTLTYQMPAVGSYTVFFEANDGQNSSRSTATTGNYTLTVVARPHTSLSTALVAYAPAGAVAALAVVLLILMRRRILPILTGKRGTHAHASEPGSKGMRRVNARTVERPYARKYREVVSSGKKGGGDETGGPA